MKEETIWNADEWCRQFREAVRTKDYFSLHDLRIQVYNHTLKTVAAGGYTLANGAQVSLGLDNQPIVGARFYEKELAPDAGKTGRYETRVEVVEGDCLVVARALAAEGEVCVLNLANRQNPGGGVCGGCGAQEEYLFRCSDYFRSLYQFAPYAMQYGVPASREHCYPMDRNFGGIFSPEITIFRDAEEKGYSLLEQPWKVNMIAVAAINRPELEYTSDGEPSVAAHLVPAVKNKMRTIFRIARDNEQTTLVLGALGCGAFRNPPAHTAELFRDVMQEPEFAGVFKHICFAIKNDHNARGAGNYEPFAKVLNPTV